MPTWPAYPRKKRPFFDGFTYLLIGLAGAFLTGAAIYVLAVI